MRLDKFLDTGLMFQMVMDLLPELLNQRNIQSKSRSKQRYLSHVCYEI